MAVLGVGEGLPRSTEIRESLTDMRGGEGSQWTAGVCWKMAEIWGMGGAATRCQSVSWKGGRESMSVDFVGQTYIGRNEGRGEVV